MQRPWPQGDGGLLGLLAQLHRSDQSGLSAGPVSSRPFPYGQAYVGASQKVAALLPQADQGEWCRKKGCPASRMSHTTLEFAVAPPEEDRRCILAREAGCGRGG